MSELSRPRLITKLRRVGGFFALFMLLVLASVYWITQDIQRIIDIPSLPNHTLQEHVHDTLGRLNAVLLISGASMAAILAMAAVLIARFVEQHFAEIEEATRRKSQFVSFVSHEMRTPLNAIAGFAQVLSGGSCGGLSAAQADCVKEIQSGARHLKQLINDILDLARIEAGNFELSLHVVSTKMVLRETLNTVRPLAQMRGISIAHNGDLEAPMRGDAHRIKQILLNLISNAIKFSPSDSVVNVEALRMEREIRFTVKDSGCGIRESEQGQLFQEFHQTDSAKTVPDGSGLGLAICRRLIELHGGRIWVESAPGAGSKFHFTIPAASANGS